MSSTIRIYRHPEGTAPADPTLIASKTDADDGAFSFNDVDTSGVPAGVYDITVTREVTTLGSETSESAHSNTLSPPQAFAAHVYYVSPTGSGTAYSYASPGSLSGGLLQLAAGDLLYLRGGTYSQQIYYSSTSGHASGTENARITIAGYPGETAVIDGTGVTLSSGASLFHIRRASYITVRDLEVRNSTEIGLKLGEAGDEEINQYNWAINVYAHDNSRQGILLSGNYCIVDRCRCYYNAKRNENGAQYLTGWPSACSIARAPVGCTIRNTTSWHNWGEGLSIFEANDSVIEDSVAYDNWSVNIYLSDARGCTVQRNLAYSTGAIDGVTHAGSQVGIAVSSEAATWTTSDNVTHTQNGNNVVINNLVAGCLNNFDTWSADADGVRDTLIAHNTMVNARGAANLHTGNDAATATQIRNNIFLQEDAIAITSFGSSTGYTFSNNVWSKTPSAAAQGSGDVTSADVGIAKTGTIASADYYRLLPGSVALGAAIATTPAVADDYDGTARGSPPDCGAFEG